MPFFKEVPSLSCVVDPPPSPGRTPRKRRSSEVPGRGGLRKEGDGGEGEKKKEGRAKSAQTHEFLGVKWVFLQAASLLSSIGLLREKIASKKGKFVS